MTHSADSGARQKMCAITLLMPERVQYIDSPLLSLTCHASSALQDHDICRWLGEDFTDVYCCLS